MRKMDPKTARISLCHLWRTPLLNRAHEHLFPALTIASTTAIHISMDICRLKKLFFLKNHKILNKILMLREKGFLRTSPLIWKYLLFNVFGS